MGGKTRRAVLTALEKEKTPTILARELHTSLPNISRALRELRSKGLVDSLTPSSRVGKIFVASERGRRTLERVREMSK